MKKLFSFSIFIVFVAFVAISCQKGVDPPPPEQITLVNPSFENNLTGWTVETAYTGRYGFSADKNAARTGNLGLNFYASQPGHFPGALQETPWNGKVYQLVTGLKDGNYTFKTYADVVGTGMYLWANGGPETQDAKVAIKSANTELNTLDFVVKGGTAKIGFICIDATGDPTKLAPYFHADDCELWTK